MKPRNYFISLLFFFIVLSENSFSSEINGEDPALYTVHFQDVPVLEFIRFVSKISKENFIFNNEDLNFHVTFSSGQPISSDAVVRALIRLLQIHHFKTIRENGYFVLHKSDEEEPVQSWSPSSLLVSSDNSFVGKKNVKPGFSVYKLQYHEGADIVSSLKNIAGDLGAQGGASPQLVQAINSLQWVRTTNSLLFSADDQTVSELNSLISSLDAPLKQVFIEILVIETDVQKGLDFGLQWAASGQYGTRVGGGVGNFAPSPSSPSFTSIMQGINASNTPTGLNQVPVVPGFDLGVIGDIITHKGTSFLSLGSLVTALQLDQDSTIVLNQKIITQDNKHSRIFVGDNIPFTGSVVTTVGQSQQTSANIEYRDVGVSLNITPKLGEGDIITLSLDEEITEAVSDPHTASSSVNGIRTTKTNMLTHVHVPDKHFLVLSGMIRNAKARHKTGIPCLGGIPWIGALFSRSQKQEEKRNVIIFVRPQIIHSFEEYGKITQNQEKVFEKLSNPVDFVQGLQILAPAD